MHERVFLTVNRLDFQRCKDFGKGHRNRVSAQCLPGFHRDRIRHDTQLQTSNVFKFGNRMLTVGKVAKAHSRPHQTMHADRFELGENLLGCGAIKHGIHLLGIGKQER